MTEEEKVVQDKAGEGKPAPPPKKEKPDKCEACGKPLSRVSWYYRDNGYYCTKRCWKEMVRKKKEEAAAGA